MRLSNSRKPAGFTLVELLVVISIVTVLAALLVPAVYRSIQTAKEAKIGIEIANIEKALERYKLEFGEYPPDFSELAEFWTERPMVRAEVAMGIINDHLSRTFRRRDIALDWPRDQNGRVKRPILVALSNLSPANALSFWLRGFSPDPTRPMFGGGTREPFFEFDESRVDYSRAIANPGDMRRADEGTFTPITKPAAPYFPAGSLDNVPYIYYRANFNTTLTRFSPVGAGLSQTIPSFNAEVLANWTLPAETTEPYRGYLGPALWAVRVNQGNMTVPGVAQVPSPYFSFTPGSPGSNPERNPATSSQRRAVATLLPYAAPQKFQLISAGMDGMFGQGGVWRDGDAQGLGNVRENQYATADLKNITNFSGGKALEDLVE